ncbi:MAG TPA: hypothetical protein VJV03_20385 [Pyrinomonadaceae bacterium]|nr:hypothetical protein [Pyrinomonadaceae bacterium]
MPIFAFSLALLLSIGTFASQDQPEFKVPCAEVVKLGLDKFMDVYSEKTQDYSTYGQKQGFSYYVDCKRAANDQRAHNLSSVQREQVGAIRDILQEIGNASWGNAYIEAGGGTLYGLASVGAYAVREDVMASIIARMTMPNDGRARRRANLALRRARRALPPAAATVELEHWDEASRADQLNSYRSNVKVIRNGFTKLEGIIRLLPDRAADIAAHRLEGEVSADVQE